MQSDAALTAHGKDWEKLVLLLMVDVLVDGRVSVVVGHGIGGRNGNNWPK